MTPRHCKTGIKFFKKVKLGENKVITNSFGHRVMGMIYIFFIFTFIICLVCMYYFSI